MSFEYTDGEKKRVFIASLFGTKLDPIGYADLGVIIGWSAVYFIQLLVVIYTLCNRNYLPIKHQGIKTPLLIFISGVSMFVGDVATSDMIHPTNKFLSNCVLVAIWLRSILGQTMILNVLSLKSISLYYKYKLRRKFNGIVRIIALLAVVWVPIGCGIIIFVLPDRMTVNFIPNMGICNFHEPFKITVTVLTWFSLLCFMVSYSLIHNVNCLFKENKRILVALLAFIAVITFHTILFFRKPLYAAGLAWRIAAVSINQVSVLVAWWSLMGETLYNCLTNRYRFLLKWMEMENAFASKMGNDKSLSKKKRNKASSSATATPASTASESGTN
ncbi:hypothetical protein GGI12_002018 [Dipsacomyces acuminosporus]|nr:hypothetical protein GGI12_002018 [Dipsacomyces acuminosporus]